MTTSLGYAGRKLEQMKSEHAINLENIKHTNMLALEREKAENALAIENLKCKKEIWEKAIDTQMHFNEMSVKSRQLGLTFVVAALGLAVVLLGKESGVLFSIPIPNWMWSLRNQHLQTHVSGLVILIASAGLSAVRRLDLGVYHRMLRGAVTFGEQFENLVIRDNMMTTQKGMTEFISLYSRHDQVTLGKDGIYVGSGKNKTAEAKIRTFYNIGIGTLFIIGTSLLIVYAKII